MVVHAPVEVAVTTLNCHVYNGEVTFVVTETLAVEPAVVQSFGPTG